MKQIDVWTGGIGGVNVERDLQAASLKEELLRNGHIFALCEKRGLRLDGI